MPAHRLDHRTARGLACAARVDAVLHRRGVEPITFAGAVAAGVSARHAGVGHERALAGDHRRRESAETLAIGHEAERPACSFLPEATSRTQWWNVSCTGPRHELQAFRHSS